MHIPLTFCDLKTLRNPISRYTLENKFEGRFDAFANAFLFSTGEKTTEVACQYHKTFTCDECCRISCILNEDGKTCRTFCVHGIAKSEIISAEKLKTYHTDEVKVFTAICTALELKLCTEQIMSNLTRIAVYSPRMGRSIGVYFAFDMAGIALPLCSNAFSKIPSPFIILTPYLENVPIDILQHIQVDGSKILRIDDCLSISDTGKVSLSVPRNKVLPSSGNDVSFSAQAVTHFEVPPGTTWGDISIHLLDRETCTITIGRSSTTKRLTEMGFKNKDKQSELFLAFANENGVLPSSEILNSPRFKQQLLRLKKILQTYFNMKDAIVLSSDNSEYRCNFKLTPESRSTLYHSKHP